MVTATLLCRLQYPFQTTHTSEWTRWFPQEKCELKTGFNSVSMWSTLGKVGLSYSELPHLHQSMHNVRAPPFNASSRSGGLVIFELGGPKTSISLAFPPKFRREAALGMRSLWLGGLRSYVVGSWGIYTGQETLTWACQKRGAGRTWQLRVKGYNNNIIHCATVKPSHYPQVQEMPCNETQISRINDRTNNPMFSFIPSLVMEQVLDTGLETLNPIFCTT